MGYVGNQQSEGFSQVPAKQDLTGATGTSLTLSHAVASAEGIDLFINNVRQEPTEAYSVVGTAVTLTGSVVATDDIYVVYNSLALQTTVPPDASVSTAKIIDGSVTATKLANTLDLSAKALTMPTGAMLQVQSTAKTDTGSFTGTSFTDLTGVSVAITPSSASSKILIQVHLSGFHDTSTYSTKFRLMRDSTAIGIGDAAGSRPQASFAIDSYGSGSQAVVTAGFHFLDSPSTTSATIYKLQGLIETGTFYFGRGNGDADNVGHGRYPTIITATEIAG
jgi:hypothetical protein